MPSRADALRAADIVVTVTGAADVITEADLALIKDGAVLCNAGHFPREIEVAAIARSPRSSGRAAPARASRRSSSLTAAASTY